MRTNPGALVCDGKEMLEVMDLMDRHGAGLPVWIGDECEVVRGEMISEIRHENYRGPVVRIMFGKKGGIFISKSKYKSQKPHVGGYWTVDHEGFCKFYDLANFKMKFTLGSDEDGMLVKENP